jgi:hypothetical protein
MLADELRVMLARAAQVNRLGLVMAYPEIEALVGLVGQAAALEILLEAQVRAAVRHTLAHALGLQAVVAWEGAQGSPRVARGQVFGAEEALAKGLLTRVLPDAEVYLKIAWLAHNSQVGPAV